MSGKEESTGFESKINTLRGKKEAHHPPWTSMEPTAQRPLERVDFQGRI